MNPKYGHCTFSPLNQPSPPSPPSVGRVPERFDRPPFKTNTILVVYTMSHEANPLPSIYGDSRGIGSSNDISCRPRDYQAPFRYGIGVPFIGRTSEKISSKFAFERIRSIGDSRISRDRDRPFGGAPVLQSGGSDLLLFSFGLFRPYDASSNSSACRDPNSADAIHASPRKRILTACVNQR